MACLSAKPLFVGRAIATAGRVSRSQHVATCTTGFRTLRESQAAKLGHQRISRGMLQMSASLSPEQEEAALKRQLNVTEQRRYEQEAQLAALLEEQKKLEEASAKEENEQVVVSEAAKQPMLSEEQESAALGNQLMKSYRQKTPMPADAEKAGLEKQLMKAMPRASKMSSKDEKKALKRQVDGESTLEESKPAYPAKKPAAEAKAEPEVAAPAVDPKAPKELPDGTLLFTSEQLAD